MKAINFGYLLTLVFCIFLIPNAEAAPGPDGFLENLFAEAIEVQQMPDASTRMVEYERLFAENFDLSRIGRFILGRNWRQLSDDQQRDFAESFKKIVVKRFGPMMGLVSLDHLKIIRYKQDEERAKLWIVNSNYKTTDGSIVKIVWRLIKTDDSYKIYDVVAEGVSFALTYRSEYSSAVQNMGIEGFLDSLRKTAGRN